MREAINKIEELRRKFHTPMGEEYMYVEAYNDGLDTLRDSLHQGEINK